MGKPKRAAAGKGSATTAAPVKKCTCDHPFNCACGNRPPRPSRGHKWDPETQAWGGKGHKQKGASGQIASSAEAAKTTSVGKTQIAQWQRLPSTLLQEYCQREKRKPPKFKNISKTPGSFLCRVILPDNKDPDKDLFFVPAHAVDNEEQATEEACILALLQQTPNLPHERKLPEPYRTTWLHAVENLKQSTGGGGATKKLDHDNDKIKTVTTTKNHNTPPNSNSGNTTQATFTTTTSSSNNNDRGGAKASTSLTLGKTYTSNAEKQRKLEEQRRERNKRIRQHEAMRMANKNHPVFLAAHLRQQIQTLLRGENVPDLDDEEPQDLSDEQNDALMMMDDGQVYVMDRLRNEGFTSRQVKMAFDAIEKGKSKMSSMSEDKWDALYEECLQWLCIHLDEDQLPEGFDPREGLLDVIVPGKATPSNPQASSSATNNNNNNNNNNDCAFSTEILSFASRYGIGNKEAKLIMEQAQQRKTDPENALWQVFQKAAGVSLESFAIKSDDALETMQEEIEALEAIFPSEFSLKKQGNLTMFTIKVTDVDTEMTLQAVVENGGYPLAYPKRLLLFGSWPKSSLYGASVHVETIKFMSTLEVGNPVIFEIYGHVQSLFHSLSLGELKPLSLLPALGVETTMPTVTEKSSQPKLKPEPKQQHTADSQPTRIKLPRKRPRERSAFWSTPPTKTPAATAFPKLSTSLDRARKSLPAFKARADFLSAMSKAEQSGRVILVTGDTGCGKTTQIPQFILEEAPSEVKIVVAQPRRLAATGVATRVANERGEDEAGRDTVGYVVRGDSAICAKTRLLFCTTGVLLRQLQSEGALENISHIVVDEVHERHLDTDVLLGFLKLTLKDFPKLRVVLMSATLDADKFASYWGTNTPRIHIPGRTFPVTDYMLEDVLALTGYVPPKNKNKKKRWQGSQRPKSATPWADSEKSDDESADEGDIATKNGGTGVNKSGPGGANHSIPMEDLVKRVDETDLDYDMLAQLVRHLVLHKGPEGDGSILVFLSGAPEISNAIEAVKRVGSNLPINVLPLHGGLQPKDQRLVFDTPRNGLTKVIFSTNVAETSITIPDCTVVIDTCREKESSFDPVNRMPLLLEQFASKASLKQRRGRAGRVREGVCYKLISRDTYNKLKDHGDPEIQRCALDQTMLSLLFLGVEHGSGSFMRNLMDPPSQDSVGSAIFSLRKLGAVTAGEAPGEICLTPLGMHLAGIPAPPSVGKLMIMGAILGCRKAALIMAAGWSGGRSPFLRVDPPRNNRRGEEEKTSIEEMKKQRVLEERKSLFRKVGNSDHSLLVAAYLQWDQANTGGGERKRICDSLGLSFNGMKDIAQLVKQYDSSLRAAGYEPSKDADRNMHSWMIIRACAVAALAPTQLIRVQRPSTKYVETVEGAVEKDGVAKELKFFIRGSVDDQQSASNSNNNNPEERVFVHPSSFNFSVGSYYCPWLVYHSMVRTSKPFLRDVSECSAYSLLLFAGDLEVQANDGVVVIDNWVKLQAKARIGSLIGGLRARVDSLLAKKIENPSFELAGTSEMKLIVKLLVSDGHG